MDTGAPTTKHITQITISHDNPSSVVVNAPSSVGEATTVAVESDGNGSDREVKPKFVVGTKKYGRRSRPTSDVLDSENEEDSEEANRSNESGGADGNNETYYVSSGASEEEAKRVGGNKVQRSASQSDIHGTKRKRPMSASRLKRCASLPPQRNHLRKPVAAREKGKFT